MYKRNKGLLRNPIINVNEEAKQFLRLTQYTMAIIKMASLKILKYIEGGPLLLYICIVVHVEYRYHLCGYVDTIYFQKIYKKK